LRFGDQVKVSLFKLSRLNVKSHSLGLSHQLRASKWSIT